MGVLGCWSSGVLGNLEEFLAQSARRVCPHKAQKGLRQNHLGGDWEEDEEEWGGGALE